MERILSAIFDIRRIGVLQKDLLPQEPISYLSVLDLEESVKDAIKWISAIDKVCCGGSTKTLSIMRNKENCGISFISPETVGIISTDGIVIEDGAGGLHLIGSQKKPLRSVSIELRDPRIDSEGFYFEYAVCNTAVLPIE